MIVRETLKNPEMIEKDFDYFNDSDDTVAFLCRSGRNDLADRLKAAAKSHFKEQAEKFLEKTS